MRPKTKLTEDQVKELETLSAFLNQKQLADYFGIPDRTLRAIMERDEKVSAAYKRGRAKAIFGISQSLLKSARDGNVTAQIFYLKTQAGWRETDRLELTGADGEAIDVRKISREIIDPKDSDS